MHVMNKPVYGYALITYINMFTYVYKESHNKKNKKTFSVYNINYKHHNTISVE